MPTYDFVCQTCRQRFDVFMTYAEYGSRPVTCTHCGSKTVRRRMTRVRVMRSEEARLDHMENEFSNLEGMEDDPKTLGRVMRKMGKEMGEELPPEFDNVVDRLESGQSPEQIEAEMPNLGNPASELDDDL